MKFSASDQDAMDAAGFEYAKPQGTFYMFVKTPVDDKVFAQKAKEYRLIVTPGSGFGCAGYVRLSYCVNYSTVEGSLPAFKALMEYFKENK